MKVLCERPLQIYLRPDQDTALRQLAKKESVSIAELVRRSVDRLLMNVPIENDPAMRLVGLGHSGKGDLAERHDYYLARRLRKKGH